MIDTRFPLKYQYGPSTFDRVVTLYPAMQARSQYNVNLEKYQKNLLQNKRKAR